MDTELYTTKADKKKMRNDVLKAMIPVLSQGLATPVYLAVDSAIVGHLLGTVSLAALAISTTVISMLSGIFIFIMWVTNTMVARFVGANKMAKAVRAGIDGVYLACVVGFLIIIIIHFFAPLIVDFYNPNADVRYQAILYLRAINFGMLFLLVGNACAGILRGFKKFAFPMIISTIGLLVNIILNLFFIAVLHMGIIGSAFGAALTLAIQTVFYLFVIVKIMSPHSKSWRPSKTGILLTLKGGLPILLRNILLWSAITLWVRTCTSISTAAVAGSQIVNSIWYFEEMFPDSFAAVLQTFVAIEIGRNNKEMAKLFVKITMRLAMITIGIMSVFNVALSFYLPKLFTSDYEVAHYATCGIILASVTMFHCGYAFVLDGAFVAVNKGDKMLKMVFYGFLIYLPFVLLSSYYLPKNPIGFMMTLIIFDGVFIGSRALFHWHYQRKDLWLKDVIHN